MPWMRKSAAIGSRAITVLFSLVAHAYRQVSAPALVGSASGDSERSIRELFEMATDEARVQAAACAVVLNKQQPDSLGNCMV